MFVEIGININIVLATICGHLVGIPYVYLPTHPYHFGLSCEWMHYYRQLLFVLKVQDWWYSVAIRMSGLWPTRGNKDLRSVINEAIVWFSFQSSSTAAILVFCFGDNRLGCRMRVLERASESVMFKLFFEFYTLTANKLCTTNKRVMKHNNKMV